MSYLRVRNWDHFQHYKTQKTPPAWIKLYQNLLSDYEFHKLSELHQARLMKLWMLAARTNNKIPLEEPWVRSQIGARSKVDLAYYVSTGWLEEVYEDSREALALTEQNREEKKTVQSDVIDVALDEERIRALDRLLRSCSDKDSKTHLTVRGIVIKEGLAVGDIEFARECAEGPGVRYPSRVAVRMLQKRAKEKAA